MLINLYSVFDQTAGAYMPVFQCQRDELAIRGFAISTVTPGHPFALTPSHFTLFAVGEFDLATGELFGYENKRQLGNGLEIQYQYEGIMERYADSEDPEAMGYADAERALEFQGVIGDPAFNNNEES